MENELFILAGNGPYLNRGCEAIVRGTVKILRSHFDSPKFFLDSYFYDKNGLAAQRAGEDDPDITHEEAWGSHKRFDFEWFVTNIVRRTLPGALKHFFYGNLKTYLPQAKAVLAIGGDNYSLDYHDYPISCTSLDEMVVSYGKPLVIWGASVGPFSKDPAYERYIIRHFKKVHLFVRETSTLNYLNEKGLIENVHRVADPAFLMDPVEPAKEKLDIQYDEGAIGLNISPLLSRHNACGDTRKWTETSVAIVQSIIGRTGRTVYLIPHTHDDFPFLRDVMRGLDPRKGRVFLIPDTLSAAEIKWVIGRMSFFAGARTHSTIAALSLCVPTLSFGYSVKSRGINQDIYGHMKYCLDAKTLTPAVVSEKISEMIAESGAITAQLKDSIPIMKGLAFDAGDILKRIL